MTGDAAIGVHVAESMPREALDLVVRSSASLAAGLERLACYGRVLSDRVAARTETHGEGLLLLVRDTGRTALHPGRAEFAVALKLAREGKLALTTLEPRYERVEIRSRHTLHGAR